MSEYRVWCTLSNGYVSPGTCANNCAAPEQRPVCWMDRGGVSQRIEKEELTKRIDALFVELEKTKKRICMRCHENKVAREFVISRVRNHFGEFDEICADCGLDEHYRDVVGDRLPPPDEWPVTRVVEFSKGGPDGPSASGAAPAATGQRAEGAALSPEGGGQADPEGESEGVS